MAELRIPGAAVAVFRRGRIVFRSGFGLTDGPASRAVDAKTLFEAASLTKPVFAAAVLALAERKEFDLDRPLVEYLGGRYEHEQTPWNPDGPRDSVTDPRLARVTARLVLSHRSGLPNIAFGRPLAFVADPGTWGYSGEGFILLQRAVEKATGRGAADLVGKTVLAPLGMKSSSFGLRPDAGGNAARGVMRDGKRIEKIGGGATLMLGSLLTSLDDFAKFTLWSARRREFRSSTGVADAAAGLEWGLGWGLARDGSDLDLFQWGWNDGYRNMALVNPRTGDGFLLLTASDLGMELAPIVMRRALGRTLPVLRFRALGLETPATASAVRSPFVGVSKSYRS